MRVRAPGEALACPADLHRSASRSAYFGRHIAHHTAHILGAAKKAILSRR
jgi:hypothetical protein